MYVERKETIRIAGTLRQNFSFEVRRFELRRFELLASMHTRY